MEAAIAGNRRFSLPFRECPTDSCSASNYRGGIVVRGERAALYGNRDGRRGIRGSTVNGTNRRVFIVAVRHRQLLLSLNKERIAALSTIHEDWNDRQCIYTSTMEVRMEQKRSPNGERDTETSTRIMLITRGITAAKGWSMGSERRQIIILRS